MAEAHILDRLRTVSDAYSRGDMGVGEARNILKDFLRLEGFTPREAGLRNLASTARLNLILRQNASMAHAAGEWQRMHDPDQMAVFPYVRYHCRGDLRTRDSHSKLDGNIYRKDDPFLRTHTPPWEFNCRCWLEEITAQEAGRDDKHVQPPTPENDVRVDSESGFSFDPEHAFEEFDLSAIKDEWLRNEAISEMKEKFGLEEREMKLGNVFKKVLGFSKEETIRFDHVDLEAAGNETKRLLPNALEVRWNTSDVKPGAAVNPKDIVYDVNTINRINKTLADLGRETDLSCIRSFSVEHLKPTSGAKTNVKNGIITLNID